MPRIRSLKPEILSNEKVGRLTDSEFRLFIGLIVSADDYGNRGGNPKQLDAEVFWGREEPADVPAMLARMSGLELVTLYKVRGQSYVHLNGWTEHQKVDHPGKPIFPRPEEADKQPDLFEYTQSRDRLARASRDLREEVESSSRLTGTGIRTGTKTRTETEGASDSSEASPEAQAPEPKKLTFSAYDLEWLLRGLAGNLRPELGMWSPGKWSSKSFDAFFRDIPEAKRVEMLPEITRRAERFFRLKGETVFTVERFLERWNELAGPAPRPVASPTQPDEMGLQIARRREENRRRAEAEKTAAAAKGAAT